MQVEETQRGILTKKGGSMVRPQELLQGLGGYEFMEIYTKKVPLEKEALYKG